DRLARPYDVVGAAPAMSTTKAPTTSHLSGLNHTALALAVYASSGASGHATQDLLPVVGHSTVRDLDPQDSYERFPSCFLHLILPSQAFLAQGHSRFRRRE